MTGYKKMDRCTLDKGLVDLWLQWISGAAGAIPAALTQFNGFVGVSRTSAGLFVATLTDGYLGLAGADGSVEQATPAFTTGWQFKLKASDVGGTTPTVTFNTLGEDAVSGVQAPADPIAGDIVRVHLVLRYLSSP